MTDSSLKPREIKCPLCGRSTFYSPENPFRPFCSERCRLIDLGQWADGKYAVPVKDNSQSSDMDHDSEFDREVATPLADQNPEDSE